MNSQNFFRGARAGMGRWPFLGAAGALMLGLTACDTDSLVELDDPDLITLPVVQDPDNVELVRNGAIFEFGRALTGPATSNQSPGIVGLGGVMSDEMWYASTFPTMKDIDARRIFPENSSLTVVYQYLHRARNLAEQAAALYAGGEATPDPMSQSLVSNIAGYTYIFFGENFCSGVPFSTASLGGELTFAPGSTTDETLNRAIERFDAAIQHAQAAGDDNLLNLARVGKARALQNLGEFDQAAAVVAAVPTDFVYNVEYSESAVDPNNGIWFEINSNGRSSVASGEGGNGIVFFARGDANNTIDPRAPADSVGNGLGTEIVRYNQEKYLTRGADVPLATGIEARLIEAEAALARGQSGAYLPILNDLRADAGLPELTDPGAADARVLQLYEERAFWMWLTGHRLGDLRRLVRHYGFAQEEVFPVGNTIFGQQYGSDVNFPIPQVEENNPEYSGSCIDRNA